jgi:membrane protein implicated in regulation of membrane protease activity
MNPLGIWWWAVAAVLIIAELFTGTFQLLVLALGAVAAALVAYFDLPVWLQFVCAAFVALAGITVLRRLRIGRRSRPAAARNPDVNLDIGSLVRVEAWQDGRARAAYRGAQWDVELATPEQDQAALWYEIVEIRGSRLIVSAAPHRAQQH